MNNEDKEFNVLHSRFLQSCEKRKFSEGYKFIDRSKKSEYLLIIVAGYQEYLWNCIFERTKTFTPDNFDVCIVVPGLDNTNLIDRCYQNNWSYLSIEEDKLSLAQNIAIKLHKNAKFIFKNDEDIFICENYFENMIKTYDKYQSDGLYDEFCFLAPCINVNAFSYINFLIKINKKKEYEELFGKAQYSFGEIWANPNTAKFIWKNSLPLDKLARTFNNNTYNYSICPIRFSIGAIMFTRKTWEKMGFFRVPQEGVLGAEESQMVEWAVSTSHPIVVSNEILVGHLGYFNQKEVMKEYFLNSKKQFELRY